MQSEPTDSIEEQVARTVSVSTIAHVEQTIAETTVGTVPGYELLSELGRGGMGVVYKARQVGLNRLVALKMILGGVHAGEEGIARFKGEAAALARIESKHC